MYAVIGELGCKATFVIATHKAAAATAAVITPKRGHRVDLVFYSCHLDVLQYFRLLTEAWTTFVGILNQVRQNQRMN